MMEDEIFLQIEGKAEEQSLSYTQHSTVTVRHWFHLYRRSLKEYTEQT